MPDETLEERVERLLREATPGPWDIGTSDDHWRRDVRSTSGGIAFCGSFPTAQAHANAALIAAAPSLLRELLDALREEQRRGDRLYEERYAALSVTTKEGMLASEWLLRTGLAERRCDAMAEVVEAAQLDIRGAGGVLRARSEETRGLLADALSRLDAVRGTKT